MKKKTKIIILETGHILEGRVAAGDKLLEKMALFLLSKYSFNVLVPKIGAQHWRKPNLNVHLTLLSSTPFDNQTNPILIFLAYCLRAWRALRKLRKTPDIKILYSSTTIFPDILPAYFLKKGHPETLWVAKVHHLVSSPTTRPGNFLVNLAAYLMQKLSLFCLKKRSDLVLVNNSQILSRLKRTSFDPKKLRLLGGCINYRKIKDLKDCPGGKKTKSYHGVFLGRLHRTKGIFDLVPIWEKVVQSIPKATLVVIGDGPSKTKKTLLRQIKKNNLEKNIHLLGFLEEERLFFLLKKAKVFLFTDHEAGWGLATAEAMACGLPVVGWDIGVLGSVYKQGFLKAPLRDYEKFAEHTIKILQNERKRQKLSQGAQAQAAQFDWSITAKKFDACLTQILQKS